MATCYYKIRWHADLVKGVIGRRDAMKGEVRNSLDKSQFSLINKWSEFDHTVLRDITGFNICYYKVVCYGEFAWEVCLISCLCQKSQRKIAPFEAGHTHTCAHAHTHVVRDSPPETGGTPIGKTQPVPTLQAVLNSVWLNRHLRTRLGLFLALPPQGLKEVCTHLTMKPSNFYITSQL